LYEGQKTVKEIVKMLNRMNRVFHAINACMLSALDHNRKIIDEMESLANKIYDENFSDKKTIMEYSVFIGCLMELHSKNVEESIVRKNKDKEGDKTVYKQ
jgi:hypothetical protein